MKLLVAVHDVTPAMQDDVEILWDMCVERGIIPALFVVPNWHGRWPVWDFPQFVERIRGFARAGAEIVLHGERHDEIGSPRSGVDNFRAFGRTANEGEFLTLSYSAALNRISRGAKQLNRLQLRPTGFVAPAWLGNQETYAAVRDAGFLFTEDDSSITLCSRAMRLPSPVFRWSARSTGRAWASCGVMRLKSFYERDSWLVRIALHPQDLRHHATGSAVRESLDRWRSSRHPWRYDRL